MLIQLAMFLVLGACLSGLVAILFCAAYARRTRRLLAAHFAARFETSRTRLAAERDHVRARAAVEQRRLEHALGRLRDEATSSRLESEMKDKAIIEARTNLVDAVDRQEEAEERAVALEAELAQVRRDRDAETNRRRELERAAEATHERQADLAAELQAVRSHADQQRISIAAMSTEIESLRLALAGEERERPNDVDVPSDNVVPIDRARAERLQASTSDVDRLAGELLDAVKQRNQDSQLPNSRVQDAEAAFFKAIKAMRSLTPAESKDAEAEAETAGGEPR